MNVGDSRGFTVFEALVASVLFFLALSVAVMSFMAGSTHYTKGRETINAHHYAYTILDMITSELREADPATLVVQPTQVDFQKYHRPTDEQQTITWNRDSSTNRIRRIYSGSSGASGTTEFGNNIMGLGFVETKRDASNAPFPTTPLTPIWLKMVKVSINVYGDIQGTSTGRRNIVNLVADVYLRQEQKVLADIYFVP
jgi:hypothetical protein